MVDVVGTGVVAAVGDLAVVVVVPEESWGQEMKFHEIEIIILLNWSGDQKGPRRPQEARLG